MRSLLFTTFALVVAAIAAGCRPGVPPSAGDDAGLPGPQDLLAFAQTGQPFLLFEPDGQRLRLLSGSATLREYAVTGLEVSRRRSGSSAPAWGGTAAGGRLSPERTVQRRPILVLDGESPADVEIPPTPEELFPAPRVFEIHFDEPPAGLAMEVLDTPLADASVLDHLWNRLRLGLRRDRPAIWVRISLEPADAAALYRALEPGVGVVVVPPPPQADA